MLIAYIVRIWRLKCALLFLGILRCRIGEASNPGPRRQQASPTGFLLEVASVTHLAHQAPCIASRPFGAMVVSEHSLAPSQQIGLRDQLVRDCFYHLSPINT